MPEYRIQQLTSPELAELVATTARVALVPLGATEQHGTHLAMGVDGLVAERLAAAVAEAAAGLAVVAPPLHVGYSQHHMAFPGTVTARPSTITALLEDVITSLRAAGLRRFLVVNGHGGNLAFLPAWMAQAQVELGVRVAVAHWSMLGRDVVTEIAVSPTIGHACEVETSLVLDLAPELVRHPLPGPSPVRPDPHPLVRGHVVPERAVGVFLPRPFEEITENGAVGDPSAASAEGGARLRAAVVERAAEFVRWLATEDDGGLGS